MSQLDPDGRGEIPVCPVCGHTLRHDIRTGVRRCDFHGPQVAVWIPTPTPDSLEEEAA